MGAYTLRGEKTTLPKERVDRAGDAGHAQHRGSIVAVRAPLGQSQFQPSGFLARHFKVSLAGFTSVLEFVLMLTIDRLSDLRCSSLKEET